jgi:hypothetical protein
MGAGSHQLYIAHPRHTRQAVKFTDSLRNSVPFDAHDGRSKLVRTRKSLTNFRVNRLGRGPLA